MPHRAVSNRLKKIGGGPLARAAPWLLACGFFSFGHFVCPAVAQNLTSGTVDGLAGKSVSDTISEAVRGVFCERRDSVVKVRARDGFGLRFGSGFFVDPAGTIYTHAGIVMKAEEVTVIHSGRELPAKVLVVDPRSGIAILKVECNSPFIPLGDSNAVEMGTPVVAVGYPQDLGASPSFGIVAGFDRQYLGQYFCTTHIRANLPVQEGQGGAPVMNLKGEAVGILVGRIDGGGACHILPMRAAEKVRLDFVRFGELRPGYAGVVVEDSTEPVGGSTARVGELDPSTPAAEGGLKTGDILLRVGSTPITTSEDVLDASFFLTAGDSTHVDVLRAGEKLSVEVRPSIHPMASRHEMQATVPKTIETIRIE